VSVAVAMTMAVPVLVGGLVDDCGLGGVGLPPA